jgi:hypothetical protein
MSPRSPPSPDHGRTAVVGAHLAIMTVARILTLRLATMPGAGLPAHVKRKDWVLIPKGKSPLHSDVDRDVAVQGYCFFQLVEN